MLYIVIEIHIKVLLCQDVMSVKVYTHYHPIMN